MPSSSHQDSNGTALSNDQKAAKVIQKSDIEQTGGKGKKNGKKKDNGIGGVLAAVRKEGKMNNSSKTTEQNTPNKTPEKSPELPPIEVTPASTPSLIVASLPVETLPPAHFGQDLPQSSNDLKHGTSYSSSPNNLISFGESPPTQPSSYEDRIPHFVADTRPQRGYQPHSASPPAPDRRRPLSYTPLSGHNFTSYESRSKFSPPTNRRSSMYSPPNRYSPHPPPPHQTQAHFYGAPELKFLPQPQTSGPQPGTGGYYCGFDKLPTCGRNVVENVVVTGHHGGLQIHSVSKRGTNHLYELRGLRGAVFDAKIIPWTSSNARPDNSILVAMVVHGPAEKEIPEGGTSCNHVVEPIITDQSSGSPRLLSIDHDSDDDDYYQTTVELYSLPRGQHVTTLLSLPKRPLTMPVGTPAFEPIPPDGSLSIRADSGYIVIASGLSGEVWTMKHHISEQSQPFTCIGKIWTTMQHNTTAEQSHSAGTRVEEGVLSSRKQCNVPILSQNGRYIAFCPPALSSQATLGAELGSQASSNRIPGLNTRAPPPLPSANCQVETPGDESMVKQILQVGTQKFIEGAAYLGGQGMQAWNSYWNKPTSGQSPPDALASQAQNISTHFPPTHSSVTPIAPALKDPGLISILDMDSLSSRALHPGLSVTPLVTFKVPHGCSFVSFAPSGLALFTASSKGDAQFVWDLMRIKFCRSSLLKEVGSGTGPQGQLVRQIAQFSRMTIARIVDVVWSSPHGERAAMVTEPGTVHILDLPASAFNWPPPIRKSLPSVRKNEEVVDMTSNAKSIVINAGSAVGSVLAATPFGRRRRSTAGTAMSVAHAGQSTQAFAAGISRSVGAATGRMNEFRKSGTTKLHLPASNTTPSRGCLTLVSSSKKDSIMLTASGVVRIYHIRTRRADRSTDKQRASKGSKFTEFRLPVLPLPQKRPYSTPHMDDMQLTEGDLESSYKATSTEILAPTRGTESTIPQAELQSNAPYQPFHTDYRRVALYVYGNKSVTQSTTSLSAQITPLHITPPITHCKTPSSSSHTKLLAFGLPIPATRLDLGVKQVDHEDLEGSRGIPSSIIERITREDGEEIVIRTRRRKNAAGGAEEELGNAADDEEWSILDVAKQQV